MQDLWKKELYRGNATLVNLFTDYRECGQIAKWQAEFRTTNWSHCFHTKMIEPVKSNKISNEFRIDGNAFYRAGNWKGAMKSYNHALRFAETGTDNTSFAYANRAICFLKMQKYCECLIDIDLAIEANYPQQLMSKLLNRKAECQKLIGLGFSVKFISKPFTPELSFTSNEKFPCMADVLEIKRNEEFGRHIVATKGIDVGQTILVEKPFTSSVCLFDGTYCWECFGINKNFVACSKCTDVMFCSTECLHQSETHFCGLDIHRMPNDEKFIATSILIALQAAPNIDELMIFVDEVLSKRDTVLPEASNDSRTKYATFLRLQPAKKSKYDVKTIYMIYNGLLAVPDIKNIFNSEKTQRFLMHLIVEHALIISNNSFHGNMWNVFKAYAVACVSSFFNHNCEPNVFNFSIANYEVYITVAPIEKGQQLFISYLSGEPTPLERQTWLLDRWNFICKCDKCVPFKPCDLGSQSIKHIGISNPMEFNMKFGEFIRKHGRYPGAVEVRAILNS